MKMKKSGFTLAEVLIVLGIIGVVAALTIPTLMNQTRMSEYQTGLKKVVAELNQAVMMNVATDNSDFADLDTTGYGDNTLYNLFINRVRTVSTSTSGENIPAGYTELFFHDGTAVIIDTAAVGCNAVGVAHCTAIVDINGHKKPNTMTPDATHLKDRYTVDLYNQVVEPHDAIGQDLLYKTYKVQASN
jgi:prepilin-type N-terminal cleavage/methylation domain-containing protein